MNDTPVLVSRLAPPASRMLWMRQVWQLVQWNLFLIVRRLQSHILLATFLLVYVLCLIFLLLSHLLLAGSVPPSQDPAQILTFPGTLQFNYGYLALLAPFLLCILAATLVGSQYGYGIHRQMLTRGLSRAQVLTAQLLALALVTLVLVALMILLALLVGVTLGPLLGFPIAPLAWSNWGGVLLSLLTQAVRLYIYVLIAVLAATLGRSTLAGISFSLGYVFLEFLATTLLYLLLGGLSARVASVIVAIIQNLPGTVSNELNGPATGLISGSHVLLNQPIGVSLFVTCCYYLLFLAATFYAYQQSDILA